MIVELWVLLVVLASVASVVCFGLWSRVPVVWLVAGLLWFVVGVNSALVEVSVVYDNSDYLKEFHFPFLVVFFCVMGAVHLVYFIFWMLDFVGERYGEVLGR